MMNAEDKNLGALFINVINQEILRVTIHDPFSRTVYTEMPPTGKSSKPCGGFDDCAADSRTDLHIAGQFKVISSDRV